MTATTFPTPPDAVLATLESKVSPNKTLPLAEHLARYDLVPGLQLAVFHKGKIIWTKNYGVRAADSHPVIKVDDDTQFQAASISKPVTAVAVLRLVEKGVLNLDVDVNDYLKRWKLPTATATSGLKTTLRLLLSHRAGLNGDNFDGYARNDPHLPDVVGVLNGDGNCPKTVIDSIPGYYRYSGAGYEIVQLVMEDVCGKPFAELMDDLVLTPAGMTRSTFRVCVDTPPSDNHALSHPFCDATISGGYLVYPESAAAGLWTTAVDLVKFALAIGRSVQPVLLTSGGVIYPPGSALLTTASAAEYITLAGGEHDPSTKHMALGIMRQGKADRMRLSHNGGNLGFISTFQLNPHSGFGFATLINGQSSRRWDEISAALEEIYEWPDVLPPAVDVGGSTLEKDDVQFDLLAGTYGSAAGGDVVVSKDGTCAFTLAEGPFALRRRVGTTTFGVDGFAETVLEFAMSNGMDQPAASVSIRSGFNSVEAKRRS
ncbi:beta-lactamase/transpeptidase-like protein [Fimicolochytrium jonesii]|uniref:beta-lactamase/transpeptidase-like protein n=1 Tax=Fimicolochytrium jonesii TaxID=1396493 RepID=UPI0022FE5693|nr:beta-lactamase/transpeptidase-like protein [Fimicolochytrium jonesii]KAI8819767.1 beta-lactamase/transpeptidase-like protein [Fimicolochytrium jonesii]